jgi:hypothetical protein
MNINNVSNPSIVFKKAKQIYGNNVNIKISDKANKKYMLLNPNTNKWTYFGSPDYQDYTYTRDEYKRERFLKRNHKWKDADKYSPAFNSYYLLW